MRGLGPSGSWFVHRFRNEVCRCSREGFALSCVATVEFEDQLARRMLQPTTIQTGFFLFLTGSPEYVIMYVFDRIFKPDIYAKKWLSMNSRM